MVYLIRLISACPFRRTQWYSISNTKKSSAIFDLLSFVRHLCKPSRRALIVGINSHNEVTSVLGKAAIATNGH